MEEKGSPTELSRNRVTGRPTGAIGTARIVWTAVVVCLSLARRMHGQCLRIVGAEKDQAGGWGSCWSRNIAWESTRCRPGSFGETDHRTQLGRLGGRFFLLNRNTSKGNNMANEEFARDQYRAGARLAGHPAAGMPSVPKALCGYRMEEQPFQVPSVWRRTPPH